MNVSDEFRNNSQYALKHRGSQVSLGTPSKQATPIASDEATIVMPPSASALTTASTVTVPSTASAASTSKAKALSSPEMIKSVSRTLTPPISPQYHKADSPQSSSKFSLFLMAMNESTDVHNIKHLLRFITMK